MTTEPTGSGPILKRRIPVTILGGYLGAGKTTLINRMLRTKTGKRLAVLVNDFGAINIDAKLIEQHDGQTISLTNGCVCCSIAGDLRGALVAVSIMCPRPDRIVIEASGVSDPGRVANYARGQEGFGVDGIVVLADSETVKPRSTDRFIGTTVRRQLEAADLVVMTKTDLVAKAQLDELRSWLCESFSDKPIVNGRRIDVAALLTGSLHERPSPSSSLGGSTVQKVAYDTHHTAITIDCPNPLDRKATAETLRSLGSDVLRCKGWLRFHEAPQSAVLVQGVGARFEFVDNHPGSQWDRLCLVVICRSDGVSPERVRQTLRVLSGAANNECPPDQIDQKGMQS